MDETTQTSKKIDSNRKNALKSTGPRSEQGKKVSRWNALKHGLLAKEVVIRNGKRKETSAGIKFLLGQLSESLEPRGILEEMLVEEIAVSYWRSRRALRCEAGEITAAQNIPLNGEGGLGIEALSANEEYERTDSKGVQERINVLERLSQEVGRNGTFSKELEVQLNLRFGPESAFVRCLCLYNDGARSSKKEAEETGKWETFNAFKEPLLKSIDHEREVSEKVKRQVQAKEELEREAKIACLDLPSDRVSGRIIRYETTIERRMHRAMEQLARLQRERKRAPTPPAINGNVNKG
jgi:hypothetical protein